MTKFTSHVQSSKGRKSVICFLVLDFWEISRKLTVQLCRPWECILNSPYRHIPVNFLPNINNGRLNLEQEFLLCLEICIQNLEIKVHYSIIASRSQKIRSVYSVPDESNNMGSRIMFFFIVFNQIYDNIDE